MDEILKDYFIKYKENKFTWEDAEDFLNIPENLDWGEFFNQIATYNYDINKVQKLLHIYYPGWDFPSISMTGSDCVLNCEHCDKKYLNHMLDGHGKEKIKKNLEESQRKGCTGALLSGGCTTDGIVPILEYKDEIREFKNKYRQFHLNSHVGLLNAQQAQEIKEIGIDTVSFDLILNNKVIQDVFHLEKTKEDYVNTYENLQEAGLRVVPHILVGAYFGYIREELDILKYLKQNAKLPELIVIIAMVPPKTSQIKDTILGEDSQKFHKLTPVEIAKILFLTRVFFPTIEISLGCMRPKFDLNQRFLMEKYAIQIGVSRIEIPSKKTQQWLENNGFSLKKIKACCAIPKKN